MEDKSKNRAGVGVGIITRGTVSIKWMSHMDKLRGFFPIGMFWRHLIVEDTTGWAKNRIEVVKQAQKGNFEWLLFIDDDVFVPRDVMQQLMRSGKDIVNGIYWTKTENEAPVIFKEEGAGPMFNFPTDQVFEIAGSGLGCTLINMKVFDAFDKAGIPYFKENWIMESTSGQNMKCPVGEDHYFFHHARKLGFKVYADSGCLCDHYDINTKKFYPSQATVRKVTGKKLEEVGREDIIKKFETELGLDKNKKTISFVNYTPNPFAGDELEKRGVGGAETCVINLARVLAHQHNLNVHVFSKCTAPGVYDNVVYHDIDTQIVNLKGLDSDLVVVSRNTSLLNSVDFKKEFGAKEVVLWAHDVATDPSYKDFEKVYDSIDKVLVLSDFHKKNIQDVFPFVEDKKVFKARNGVDKTLYANKVEKVPGRLIYSSTPFRGLEILAEVFPEIKKRVPHATLHVFSSMDLYGKAYSTEEFDHLYKKLGYMDGVKYSRGITQKELAVEQMQAEVLAYPNTFPETSCITVMECQMAGTPCVTSKYAALDETVPDGTGIKLEGKPFSDEYKKQFIDSVVELLTNKEKWQEMSDKCLSLDVTWDTVAKEWANEFFPKEEDVDDIKQVGNINTKEYWDNVYQNEIKINKQRADTRGYDDVLKDYNGGKLLDVGCGTGHFTRHVREKYPQAEIWGSDFSISAIDYCRQQNKTIYYTNHPLLNSEYEKKYFDTITMLHLVEHLDKPKELISRAKDLLSDVGTLVLVIPYADDDWREHLKIWRTKDVEELLSDFECEYDIKIKYNKNKQYKDGRYFKEMFVHVKFEVENGN